MALSRTKPITSSPGLNPVVAAPACSTTPARSQPGGHGEEGVHERIRGSALECQIRRVEGRCLDPHQNEIVEHLRIWDIHDFEDLGSAEVLVLNDFHGCAFRVVYTVKLTRVSTREQ
jgi:hypothetical protein